MRPLAICLLLLKHCFAHVYGRHETEPRMSSLAVASSDSPSEYLDNINNREWTIPDVKFIYNYKQMNQNHPSQIEQREGNLHEHEDRYPATVSTLATTTTPRPQIPQQLIGDFIQTDGKPTDILSVFDKPIIVIEAPHHRHHHHHHHHPKHPNHAINHVPNFPEKEELNMNTHPPLPASKDEDLNLSQVSPVTMPPPPVLPDWENLNKLLKHHHHKSKPHHITAQKQEIDLTPSATPTTAVLHKKDGAKNHTHSPHHPLPTHPKHHDIAKTVLHDIPPIPFLGHNKKNKPQHIYRGNHKFSWDDVTQSPLASPSTAASKDMMFLSGKSPPPVPTLSPWYDGFGK